MTNDQREMIECIGRAYKDGYSDGYNQALEDFKKELIKIYYKRYMHDIYLDDIEGIVEQLKK